jgi:predicted Fe-Mo cluster-binding NifX family protein
MRIAISSTGPDLDAQVDPRFGRCRCFIVVDPASEAFEVLDNEAAAISGGAGIQAAQMVADAGVEAVITGSLGPNATDVLSAAGLKVYLGASGTVREALRQYKTGRLQAGGEPVARVPSGPGALGAGPGMGMGRGMGRGRGRGRGCGAGVGPGGHCFCPGCGTTVPHQPGVPCFQVKCPKCGTTMRR